MDEIKTMLEARARQLLQIKKEKERALLHAPEGNLRICCHNGKTQYYYRDNPKDFNGTYIRESDIVRAQKLAQKEYDKKVLASVEKEIKAIKKYFSSKPDKEAEQVYKHLHVERQKLIIPIIEPDEQYRKNWESVEYQGKEFYSFTPEYYTAKGERVRSKSEVIIADALYREGISYRYEYPIYLEGIGEVYPDFTALNIRSRKEILWEHFGKMGDQEYADKAIRKIESYERNGIFTGDNLILTYESMNLPLNQKTIQRMIERYLK